VHDIHDVECSFKETALALIGRTVTVVFVPERVKGRMRPATAFAGVVEEVHRHGFVVRAARREFVSYVDLFCGHARLEGIPQALPAAA
jgi:hypothetical protein